LVKEDLTGRKFNLLTVVSHYQAQTKRSTWKCICDCGNDVNVSATHLKSDHTKSCGCLKIESQKYGSITHKLSKTAIHRAWQGMIQRCTNKKLDQYINYGARGITFCDRWKNFLYFVEDMVNRPEGTSLDRIDNNGSYCKENCKWSTPKEQANNRRTSRMIKYNGKEQTLMQWSKELNINYGTLNSRINRYHWSTEKALSQSIRSPAATISYAPNKNMAVNVIYGGDIKGAGIAIRF